MKNIKLLWNYLKGYRLIYFGAIVAVALAALLATVGPLVLRVTIDSIIGDKPMELPLWAISIIKAVGGKDSLAARLWIPGGVIVFLTLLRGIFLFFKGKWSAVAAESIARDMREKLYGHLQNLPYAYHVKVETGDLIQRCTSDVDQIRRFLAVQLAEIGRGVFMLVFVLSMMLTLHIRMTLVAMLVVPIIILFSFFFYREVTKTFKDSDEAEGRMSTVLQENLTGVRVVRAFARQVYEIEKFDVKSIDYRDKTYRVLILLAWFWSISDFLSMLQIGIVLIVGAYWATNGVITLGTLVVFITYEGMLLWPIRQMGRLLTDLGKTLVSVNRVEQILREPVEEDEPNALKPEIKGNIVFDNVYFSYDDNNPVLEGVSFEIKQGDTVAILGPTGSGKSSLVQLLIKLYDYQQGSIKIDGNDIKEIDRRWLRKNIGLVLQEPFLFARSIKENIALAARKVDESEVFEAAKNASLHDVIMDFDKGYETLVGERGVSLSGGQKQRMAIARTLIRNCPVLVFDDSLSAVDTETDARIRKALLERKKEVTTIIISHRISTLAEADKIIVIEEGKVNDIGSHQQLINRPGLYKRIWEIQNFLEQEMIAEGG